MEAFIRQYAALNAKKVRGIEKNALDILVSYDWPGNIRELKNVVERMIVLSSGDMLTTELISEDIRQGRKGSGGTGLAPLQGVITISDAEKELIRNALAENKGNKSAAAEKLGISRRTLYRKIEEYKLV